MFFDLAHSEEQRDGNNSCFNKEESEYVVMLIEEIIKDLVGMKQTETIKAFINDISKKIVVLTPY
jgi:hypothetical protein